MGICNASAIMVGKQIGEGDREGGYRTAKRFVLLTPSVAVFVGMLMIFLRMPILNLLPVETEGARQMAATLLLWYAVWLPIKMIPYTLICGIFRAGGDTKTGCIIDFLSLYLVGIPTVVILGFFTDIPVPLLVFLMYVSEDIPKMAMCARHFFKRKWIIELSDRGVAAHKE